MDCFSYNKSDILLVFYLQQQNDIIFLCDHYLMIKDIWRHKISCNDDIHTKHKIEKENKVIFTHSFLYFPELFQYGKLSQYFFANLKK